MDGDVAPQEALTGQEHVDFEVEQVQLQFAVKSAVKRLVVRANMLCMVLITGTVYRIDLDHPEVVATIQLPLKTGVLVDAVFVDVKGYHLIVKTSKLEYYYVSRIDTKWKHLSKLKGSMVTSMVFVESLVTESSTGPILVTVNDRLVQYHIDHHNESSIKQVHAFKAPALIVSAVEEDMKLIVNLIADFKMYQLSTALSHIKPHLGSKMEVKVIMQDSSVQKITSNSTSFGYICSLGISFGLSTLASQKELETIRLHKPVTSILVAKFHILVLTEDNELLVYEKLSHQLVQTHTLDQFGERFVGLESDEVAGTYWAFSESKIFEIVTENESAGIWKLLLEMGRYDDALDVLDPVKDFSKCQAVLSKKASFLFSQKEYMKAARIYGTTNDPFEDVALQFMDLQDKSILREYLLGKLHNLPKHYSGQAIILGAWIVELFVEDLNRIDKELIFSPTNVSEQKSMAEVSTAFHKFCKDHASTLDKDTIYEILESHDRTTDLLTYANEIKDYNFVLKNCMQAQRWEDALEVLLLHGDPDLVYQSCTALIINEPAKTIQALMRLHDQIDPLKIIPSLLVYNKNIAFVQGVAPEFNQAVVYLKFLIYEKKLNSVNIHNTFLTILITYPGQTNETYILKHLDHSKQIHFDYDFILRLCFKFKRIQSAVTIYTILGKYENGVMLAMDNDMISVSLRVADRTLGINRKKLWLLIANKLINSLIINDNFITENAPIFTDYNSEQKPMGYLIKFLISKCDLLNINDLLPLVPDFVIIDDFKEDIVEELTNTATKIAKMTLDMDESLKEAENNKERIKNFKNDSFQTIEPYDSCLICHKLLSLKKFYIFPCFHSFHQDCLVQEILRSNDYKLKSRIFRLQKSIKLNSGNSKAINDMKKEIDDILSSRCCLCTDININLVEEPLVKANVPDEWAL